MNGSLSDGNENIVDIFILSTSSTDSPLQASDLEELGYRTTFFSNAQQLFESLRSGKPNLLICDSVTLREDSYDLCRSIKADYDLWVVPVLIITGASNLADLLHVLDCNADNYISSPYDPSYFSSLVEGMLSTPVERQTPDQIKTQFKIQHEDHLFVVTADRRRLLEFLLSSFEIAVNRSADIIRITGEKDILSASLRQKEGRVQEQARLITNLEVTVQQKDEAIRTLTADSEDKDLRIRKDSEEIQRLLTEIESGKTHIAAAEEQVNQLTREADDLTHRYATETGDLGRQLESLSEHLAVTRADLKAAEESLILETSKKTEAETLLSEIYVKKEQAEKNVQALTLEVGQLQASLAAEKDRVQSLEAETAALSREKDDTEQNLSRTISELNETARQQSADLARQNGEINDGKNHIINLEIQLATIRAEKERTEEELRTSAEASARNLADLQEKFTSTSTTLLEREQDVTTLETELSAVMKARDAATRDLQELLQEYNTLKDSLDEQRSTMGRMQSDLDAAHTAHLAAEGSLEMATARIQELESELVRATSSGKGFQQQIQDLTHELGQVKIQLDESRKQILGAETDLVDERRENERIACDRDAAISARSDTDDDLAAARARIQELESESKSVTTVRAQAEKQVHALTDELEQLRSELENSRRLRRNLEESLTGERLEKEQVSADLQKASRENESLAESLAEERQVRTDAESERDRLLQVLTAAKTEGKSQETSMSATMRELTVELESSHAIRKELEERVSSLLREKQRADERVSDLSAEIDQARAALADEWGDHMDAQERLVAAAHEKQRGEQSSQASGELESEKAKKRALIVKGPDLPMNIGKGPQSLSAVRLTDPAATPVPGIRNVEDLFEDEEILSEGEARDMPSVSIIHEPVSDDEETDGAIDENTTGSGIVAYDNISGTEIPDDTVDDEDEAVQGDDSQMPSDESSQSIPSGIAFNRAQWFDLLKWAHHSGTLTQEQRIQIVRMGRLIQKGRKLTHKQEEQVKEMLILVQAQGYRFI